MRCVLALLLMVTSVSCAPNETRKSPTELSESSAQNSKLISVVIVRDGETSSKLPQSILNQFTSIKIRDYCFTHCILSPESNPEFRIFDENTDVSKESKSIRDLFKQATDGLTKDSKRRPWVAISSGASIFNTSLPTTEAETLKLLKKYGGE